MLIRKAELKDAADLAKIKCDTWKASYKHIIDADTLQKEMQIAAHEKKFANQLESSDKNSVYFVAENERNEVLGYILLLTKTDNSRDDEGSFIGKTLKSMQVGSALLSAIYVLPQEQGKGIGRALLDYAKSFCRNKGITEIFCECFAENQSGMKFHLKNGAEIIGVEKGETFDKPYDGYKLKWEI